jgi:hypothetical protein
VLHVMLYEFVDVRIIMVSDDDAMRVIDECLDMFFYFLPLLGEVMWAEWDFLLYVRIRVSPMKPHRAMESPAPCPDPRKGSGCICLLYEGPQPYCVFM